MSMIAACLISFAVTAVAGGKVILPALRRLAGALDGAESFLRTALGLEVFAERGLVTLAVQEDMMILRPVPGRRADLEQSAYMRALRRVLKQDASF